MIEVSIVTAAVVSRKPYVRSKLCGSVSIIILAHSSLGKMVQTKVNMYVIYGGLDWTKINNLVFIELVLHYGQNFLDLRKMNQ